MELTKFSLKSLLQQRRVDLLNLHNTYLVSTGAHEFVLIKLAAAVARFLEYMLLIYKRLHP